MQRKTLVFVALVASMSLLACAANSRLVKQRSTETLSAIETTLTQARIAEQALFDSDVPGYNAAKHLEFLNGLDKAQVSVIAAARALQLWVPGGPVPGDVLQLMLAAEQMVSVISGRSSLGPVPPTPEANTAVQRTASFRDHVAALVKLMEAK